MVLGYAIVNVRYISAAGERLDQRAGGLASRSRSSRFPAALIIVLGEAMRRARDRYRVSEVAGAGARARSCSAPTQNKSQLPRRAVPRAAQPARAAAHRRSRCCACSAQADAAAVETLRHDGAADRAALAPDRRSARRVSRIDRGKLELRTERLQIDAVLRTAIDTAKPNIDAQGHQLDGALPARAALRRRRPGAPRAGGVEPPQ